MKKSDDLVNENKNKKMPETKNVKWK